MTHPPTSWEDLYEWLETIETALPGPPCDSIPRFSKRFDNRAQAAEWYASTEKTHGPEIERTIVELSANGEGVVPALTPLAAEFLRERIQQVCVWINELRTKSGYPIDFPDMPPERLVRWLLIEWWEEHGRENRLDWHYLMQEWT